MVTQDADNLTPPRIVILGGGVAGLAAGVRLAQAGIPVTLIETRKRLGGRATSFVDPATGDVLDNCQHVLMRCCTTLVDLYDRLGVSHLIDWHGRYHFVAPDGHIDTLEADDLPAPAHLSRSLFNFKSLSFMEKTDVVRGMFAMFRTSKRQRNLLADVSFTAWLRTRDQPDETIAKFWDLIIISACNETPNHVAAKYALQVFQEGMLNNNIAFELGL
ncbi:MAG: FAD-dependent oxidoreductase, partial [Rhodospirillales bacterium]|nr:FAD-dependent oxidoreductase [Rhodospirillales bacterium]